ncbi:periplasmic iron-binding protein [Roseibium aquae]|uniref:Periplasmic iron-binding protein n=1 Tax=Roseibium aquae TaxID=1323746 RepID=A0A916X124_9HYPH|nr:extracellular solute-binding protein [Roseibium aquae]GGB45787.1 periplasmic iron-binding protein [Roseibium aquae]
MRLAYLIGLIVTVWTGTASSLDVEEYKRLEGTGERVLRILSTGDLALFSPFLASFHARNPQISIEYSVVSSGELHRAIRDGANVDVAISSAMDLQFQLVNDGLAKSYRSAQTASLPDWARWRDQIFAFTAEPAVVVISAERFQGLPIPETRQEVISVLRDNPDRFKGAIGTYDVRDSGLGYLFATQEARSTDAYWRLSEVLGRLAPRLYCCSGQMIEDVANGQLALAYNVLGSYAAEQAANETSGRVQILRMQDFSNVILRTAIIPATAQNIAAAGAFVDGLIAAGQGNRPGSWALPLLDHTPETTSPGFGPIRLGPALMIYLDPLNKRAFLEEWENAMVQRQTP